MSHPEVAGGESDDGGLVQLTRDGSGQRQQLPQLKELQVLLLATISRRVLRFVLLRHAIDRFFLILEEKITEMVLIFPTTSAYVGESWRILCCRIEVKSWRR